MPGGKVVVYTRLLALATTDDELAVIMGHEIAHAIARHGNERMSQGMAAQGLGATLGAVMGNNPNTGQSVFLQAYGIGSVLGILSYSRKHETEADKLGLVFMKMAGYDPTAAIKFWTKMSELGGQAPPELLSTHPSDAKRIKDNAAFIPELTKHL
jgi:predicted Zn-dependent protease